MDDIYAWLNLVGLSRYEPVFRKHQIDFDVLPDLTLEDLREMEIPLGDRKRILAAIATLRDAEPEATQKSPGVSTVPEASTARTAAERRQLTIVFCDLVGSTELTGQLDPEELGAAMNAYQDCCQDVVGRWGGHLAEFLGDGAVLYFGWPTAHEDDAERAVHASMELVRATGRLSVGDGVPMAVRIGIATGLVLVGEIKSAGLSQREGVVGETPNLAARVQSIAPPGAIAITSQTRRLIGDRFILEDWGKHEFKGIRQAAEVWLVKATQTGVTRFDARAGKERTPLVGRRRELDALVSQWNQSVRGTGQAAVIVGEAGIGKSRLVSALMQHAQDVRHAVVKLQCSPYHTSTPLIPFIEWLKESAGVVLDTNLDEWDDRIQTYLSQQGLRADDALPLIRWLLSDSGALQSPALNTTPQQRRERTISVLIDLVRHIADTQPLLLVIEDLHWADPTTLELLRRLVQQMPTIQGFLLASTRPELAWPFEAGSVERIELSRLDAASTTSMVDWLTQGKVLPKSVQNSILTTAEGIPLFVEEVTRSVVESGGLHDAGDRYEIELESPEVQVPSTLQDLLMARLDSLPSGKPVAQVAATLGRSFSRRLLQYVLQVPGEELSADLQRLCDAGILDAHVEVGDDVTYVFRHALVWEAAYHSQLNSRRRSLHLDVASVLERHYPSIIESEPELMARHYEAGGQLQTAAEYLLTAGRRAIHASATHEAIALLSKGLNLIHEMPHSQERDRIELRLQAVLGTSYMQARGWAAKEVANAYSAAAVLSGAAATTAEEIWILWGVWVHTFVRGRINDAVEASKRIQALADRDGETDLALIADMVSLQVSLYAGRFHESQERSKSLIRHYDPQQHGALKDLYSTDLQLVCYIHHSIASWILGQVELAEEFANLAKEEAESLDHPYSLAWCNTWGALVDLLQGDDRRLAPRVTAAIRVAQDQEYAYIAAMGKMMAGWIEGTEGHPGRGAETIRGGLVDFEATGAEVVVPFFKTLRAELLVNQNRPDEALDLLLQAKHQIDAWGERWQEAEVYRVEGNALASKETASRHDAEASYRRAIEIAVEQGAIAWQLRACTDFARYLGENERAPEAIDLLRPVVAHYSNAPRFEDVARAVAVLERLES